MKIDEYVVVLDACVLAPLPIADTLLRLAEEPAFYIPRWSPEILGEIERTLRSKFKYTDEQVKRRITAMQESFPDASDDSYHDLVPAMKNHEKDRHVPRGCGEVRSTCGRDGQSKALSARNVFSLRIGVHDFRSIP
jgi:hypothetical protein